MFRVHGLILCALLACDATQTENLSLPAKTTTYHRDVAPILATYCLACHHNGGVQDEMPFDSYARASAFAQVIADATAARRMPPWAAVDDGTCGDFRDSRWMSEEDIGTLSDWVAAGTPEGATSVEERSPAKPRGSLTGEDVTILRATEDYAPRANQDLDEYRCLSLDSPFGAETAFVGASDVIPGNAAIVHHVLLMLVDPEAPAAGSGISGLTNGELMEILDRSTSDDRVGWPCLNGAGSILELTQVDGDAQTPQRILNAALAVAPEKVQRLQEAAGGDLQRLQPLITNLAVSNSTQILHWAPGAKLDALPQGTAFHLPSNAKFVVQMHYNLSAAGVTETPTDSTSIHLRRVEESSVQRIAAVALQDPMLAAAVYWRSRRFVTPPGIPVPYSDPARISPPPSSEPFSIPPGEGAYQATWRVPASDLVHAFSSDADRARLSGEMQVLGYFPHMHEAGAQMQLQHHGASGRTCALEIDRWDFGWQLNYYREAPKAIGVDDYWDLSCTWSTLNLQDAITPGWGTQNEMCLMGFIISAPRELVLSSH